MRRLMGAQLSMVRHVEPLLTLEGLRGPVWRTVRRGGYLN
ncbi:MAG: hypothetical protein Ct9H300mP7_0760 [Verrucomicrobiota bacterium]|nr:MAG: hypothetical protein Ct9H300mP7_0760 [Verrucomicrobiota bacterium]